NNCEAFKSSEQVSLLLRPSAAQIVGNEQKGANTIKGRVQDCVFQGQTYNLTLECQNGITLTVHAPQKMSIGTNLSIFFPPELIQCLKEK
ncbi:MAG: TOBE domain-containing protein, partial [Anaerolineaceae bacterium]|nr:TOBE domain-containing protein [Anaerolineaceae bacterium]